jgi:hypothetical protein
LQFQDFRYPEDIQNVFEPRPSIRPT